jgi:FdrA protein
MADAKRDGLEFVVIIVGTEEDPQNLERQAKLFKGVGANVFTNSSEALGYVGLCLRATPRQDRPAVSLERFSQPFAAINVGLESFYDSLTGQGAAAVQVDWQPPAGGNERLAAILAKMKTVQ